MAAKAAHGADVPPFCSGADITIWRQGGTAVLRCGTGKCLLCSTMSPQQDKLALTFQLQRQHSGPKVRPGEINRHSYCTPPEMIQIWPVTVAYANIAAQIERIMCLFMSHRWIAEDSGSAAVGKHFQLEGCIFWKVEDLPNLVER